MSPPAPVAADTIFYVSTRARAEGFDTRQLADSLEFGYAVFVHRSSPAERGAPEYEADIVLADSALLSEGEFAAALRAHADRRPSPDDFAVFYVHGYGTSLHEAWTHTATARIRSGDSAPWVVFAWPSNGTGVTMPRRGALLDGAYQDDSVSAAASLPAFARATRAVTGAVGAGRLVLTAHSLGGQVAGEALASDTALRVTLGAAPLRAIAFIAPDVEARRFADYHVPALLPLTRRLVLYTSRRDRLLLVSRQLHGTNRAGLSASPPLVRPGLETVDTSDGVTSEGWGMRLFGTHHSIRRAVGTLVDLTRVVGPGFAASCRATLGTATLDEDGVWRLTPLVSTGPDDRSGCERH